VLLDLGKRTEQRRVMIAVVVDELLVRHLRIAAEYDREFDHGSILSMEILFDGSSGRRVGFEGFVLR
jgi:hypothetical protein